MEYRGGMLIVNSDIFHHGILGQRWGKRNGPPYPLSNSAHSRSEVTAGWQRSVKSIDTSTTGAFFRKKKKKSEKISNKSEKGSEEYEAEKQEAIIKGKASDVLKYKGDLTNDQMQYVINRIRLENQLEEYKSNETSDAWTKMNNAMNRLNTVNNWANIGLNSLGTVGKVYKKLFPDDPDDPDDQQTQNEKQNKQKNN